MLNSNVTFAESFVSLSLIILLMCFIHYFYQSDTFRVISLVSFVATLSLVLFFYLYSWLKWFASICSFRAVSFSIIIINISYSHCIHRTMIGWRHSLEYSNWMMLYCLRCVCIHAFGRFSHKFHQQTKLIYMAMLQKYTFPFAFRGKLARRRRCCSYTIVFHVQFSAPVQQNKK